MESNRSRCEREDQDEHGPRLLQFRPILFLAALSLSFALSSCITASINMLPRSAADVDFSDSTEGKTGWSEYRERATFEIADEARVIAAAKDGLGSAGFALLKVDRVNQVVFGEHGATLHDWNVVAGIYYTFAGTSSVEVLVIAQGSKDTGFSGDVTGGAWTAQILHGMRRTLQEIP